MVRRLSAVLPRSLSFTLGNGKLTLPFWELLSLTRWSRAGPFLQDTQLPGEDQDLAAIPLAAQVGRVWTSARSCRASRRA